MDFREGTWTMTEGEKIQWDHDADEIIIDTGCDQMIWLSETQTVNMIAGLSHALNEMRRERGRG